MLEGRVSRSGIEQGQWEWRQRRSGIWRGRLIRVLIQPPNSMLLSTAFKIITSYSAHSNPRSPLITQRSPKWKANKVCATKTLNSSRRLKAFSQCQILSLYRWHRHCRIAKRWVLARIRSSVAATWSSSRVPSRWPHSAPANCEASWQQLKLAAELFRPNKRRRSFLKRILRSIRTLSRISPRFSSFCRPRKECPWLSRRMKLPRQINNSCLDSDRIRCNSVITDWGFRKRNGPLWQSILNNQTQSLWVTEAPLHSTSTATASKGDLGALNPAPETLLPR